MCKRKLIVIAFSALLCASLVQAQESRATLSGAVTDPSGANVAGARITATEVRTGVKSSTVSDAAGQYNLPFLPPGDYEVRAEAAGFRAFVRSGLQLTSSAHPRIDIPLQVGGN